MAASPTIAVNIVAKNSASGTLAALNKQIASATKQVQQAQAPFTELASNAKKFAQVTGISKIATSLSSVARSGFSAFQSVARIVEPLAAISGAASIAGMMRLATSWANFGTQLGNAANRAGLTSDQLMTLENAGRLAGVSADTMASGMTSLRDNMVNAVGGKAPQVIGMLQALGLSLDDAKRFAADTTKALPELADKIAGLKDPTLQAQAATALFGGAGEAMLPFLRKGAAGIAEYTEKAQKYGLINADGVTAANNLREAQTSLTMAVEGLGYSVAQKLSPILTPLLGQMADWIAANRDWIAQGIGDKVQQFADYLKGVDWAKVGTDVEAIATGALHVATELEGALKWMNQMGLVGPALGVVLGLKLLAPLLSIGKALGAIGAFSPPAWMLGSLGVAGFVAEKNRQDVFDKASGGDPSAIASGLTGQYIPPETGPMPNGGFGMLGSFVSRLFGARSQVNTPSNGNLGAGLPSGPAGPQWASDLKQLQSYGWSKEQSAGILGNISQESEGKENAVGDNKTAYGLAQWHADRQAAFAKQFGHDIHNSTHAEQIAFVNWELNNTEKTAGDHLRQSQSARESASAVRKYYERPADASGQEDAWRGDRADRILSAPETVGPPLSLPANAGTSTSPGGTAPPIAPPGQVNVGVRFDNVPPGTQTTAVQSGAGLGPLRVERTDVGFGNSRDN